MTEEFELSIPSCIIFENKDLFTPALTEYTDVNTSVTASENWCSFCSVVLARDRLNFTRHRAEQTVELKVHVTEMQNNTGK